MEVVIEISKGTNLKYEYDFDKNKLILDRVLHNTNFFPYNYGFIPNTLSPDGDPADIILLSSHSLTPGCFVKVKVIGLIETSDEKGGDDKIVCVLDDSIDKEYEHINDISQISEYELNNIIYFLSNYKNGEKDKFIKLGNILNKTDAISYIEKHKV